MGEMQVQAATGQRFLRREFSPRWHIGIGVAVGVVTFWIIDAVTVSSQLAAARAEPPVMSLVIVGAGVVAAVLLVTSPLAALAAGSVLLAVVLTAWLAFLGVRVVFLDGDLAVWIIRGAANPAVLALAGLWLSGGFLLDSGFLPRSGNLRSGLRRR